MQPRTNSPVEQIKQRLSIEDVLSGYLTLVSSGPNFKARCPFHNEKTPSFFVSTERNSYYCFGCSAKGDIFSFVEQFEGVDFRGALKILAARAGVDLKEFKGERDSTSIIYEIMEAATTYFEKEFARSPAARAYLIERGLTDATIAEFRIGFAPDAWQSVSTYLTNAGYTETDIARAGLIKKSEKSTDTNRFYDRFRSRIMFPISDSSGRVIAFSGRIFGKETDIDAKYLNSPETEIFNKSSTLFGIDKAKFEIRKRGYAIIVEGQMDLLLSHQAGFTHTVATSGTALTAQVATGGESIINNLGLIRRLAPNVLFAFDGDTAGVRAAGRASKIALSLDMQAKIAVLPDGRDPADIIKDDSNEWKTILKNAKHIVTFFTERIIKEHTDMRAQGRAVREIVFPYISAVKSAIERAGYLKEVASLTGIPLPALTTDFESFDKSIGADTRTEKEIIPVPKVVEKKDDRARRFFGALFYKEQDDECMKALTPLYDSFKEAVGEGPYGGYMGLYEPYKEVLALEAEMWYGNDTAKMIVDLSELALNIEEEVLTTESEQLRRSMNEVSESSEKEALLTRYQTCINRIHHIKSRRSQ